MTTLETLKWDGKKSGKVTLDLAVAKETSSADLIHRAVLRQLANKRQGTASTLTRSEVRGEVESHTNRKVQEELVKDQ